MKEREEIIIRNFPLVIQKLRKKTILLEAKLEKKKKDILKGEKYEKDKRNSLNFLG